MKKTISLLVALLTACVSIPLESNEIISENIGAQSLPSDFYVRINLKVRKQETEQYPQMWAAMQRALEEWSLHIPVHFKVHVLSVHARAKGIAIRLTDLASTEFRLSDDFLGIWYVKNGVGFIGLDDKLEDYPELAFSTSLHELGHMLGLPHLTGREDTSYTGWILLPPGVDAENYVMYPRRVPGKPQSQLSEVEIELAHHTLVYLWTQPNGSPRVDDCEFSLDKRD